MKSNNIQEVIDVLNESVEKLERIKAKAMAEEVKEEDLRSIIKKLDKKVDDIKNSIVG